MNKEELVHGFDRAKEEPSQAAGFAVRTGGMGRGRGRVDKSVSVCNYCKKPGHIAANCYSLQVCTHCQKKGHIAKYCYEIIGYPEGWSESDKGGKSSSAAHGQGRGVVRANATSGSRSEAPQVAASNPLATSNEQVFTSEQWRAIAGFFW